MSMLLKLKIKGNDLWIGFVIDIWAVARENLSSEFPTVSDTNQPN